MSEKYEIHFQPRPDRPVIRPEGFSDFTPFLAYITCNKTDDWSGRVSVRLPPRATEEERGAIQKLGLAVDA